MKGVPVGRRSARLRAATALIYDDGGQVRERVAEAAIEGVIAERAYPLLREGFPYRAVLFMPERNCFVGELGDEEEAKISQRRIALAKLHDDLARIAAGGRDRL
jgi:inosine/xanthosine triphosphate pyrophosphatase family protein